MQQGCPPEPTNSSLRKSVHNDIPYYATLVLMLITQVIKGTKDWNQLMYWLFNLLYWSTLGTKGNRCDAAGNRNTQAIPFRAFSALSSVHGNTQHNLTSLGTDLVAAVWRENEWRAGEIEKVGDKKALFSCPVKETSTTDIRIPGTLTLTVTMESSDHQVLMFYGIHIWGNRGSND